MPNRLNKIRPVLIFLLLLLVPVYIFHWSEVGGTMCIICSNSLPNLRAPCALLHYHPPAFGYLYISLCTNCGQQKVHTLYTGIYYIEVHTVSRYTLYRGIHYSQVHTVSRYYTISRYTYCIFWPNSICELVKKNIRFKIRKFNLI